MTAAARSHPGPHGDPQTMDRTALIPAIMRRVCAPDTPEDVLRDVLEILLQEGDWETFTPRAPFQCAHCGLIAHSPVAREIHFGDTPDLIPLCLAPRTAQALLFQLRMIAINERLGWTMDLPKLIAAAETAMAAASPDAPRSVKRETKTS